MANWEVFFSGMRSYGGLLECSLLRQVSIQQQDNLLSFYDSQLEHKPDWHVSPIKALDWPLKHAFIFFLLLLLFCFTIQPTRPVDCSAQHGSCTPPIGTPVDNNAAQTFAQIQTHKNTESRQKYRADNGVTERNDKWENNSSVAYVRCGQVNIYHRHSVMRLQQHDVHTWFHAVTETKLEAHRTPHRGLPPFVVVGLCTNDPDDYLIWRRGANQAQTAW